jgi:hypothetical protein
MSKSFYHNGCSSAGIAALAKKKVETAVFKTEDGTTISKPSTKLFQY